jgi:hypothetical protein
MPVTVSVLMALLSRLVSFPALFVYDYNQTFTSNGSAATESDHWRFLTVAEQETAKLKDWYGTARSGTAGGGSLRIKTFTTPSTGGTSYTLNKKNPNNPAAQTTAFYTPTAGGTPVVRLAVGLAQTGGQGGYLAPTLPDSIDLLANGGANGNLDIFSIFNAASIALDISGSIQEGS